MPLLDKIAGRLGFQRIIDTKDTAVAEVAAGIHYDMRLYQNWMEQYWNPNPVHRAPQWTGYQLYQQMDADGHVYNSMSMRKVALLSRPVVVRSAIPGNPTEDKKAALVAWNFDHIKKLLQKKRNILSDKDFGYSVSELIYEFSDVILPAAKVGRSRQFRGGTIEQAFVIKDIKTKIPSAFGFDGNHDLYMTIPISVNRMGLSVGANVRKLTPEERLHFIVSTHDPNFDNDYGDPLKAHFFWDYLMKKAVKIYRMIFVEKYGMPFWKGTYPPGMKKDDPQVVAFNALLAGLQKNSWISHAEGFAVDAVEVMNKSGTIDVYQNVLDFCDGNISETCLGHRTAVQEEGDNQSPFQNTDSKSALRQDLLEMDAAALDAVFNDEIIPILIDMNFERNGLYPYVKTIVEPEADLDKEVFRLQAAYNMHIPLSLNQQYEKFGWEKPNEDDPDDLLLLEEEKQEKGAVPIEKQNGQDEGNPDNLSNAMKEQAMSRFSKDWPKAWEAFQDAFIRKMYGMK